MTSPVQRIGMKTGSRGQQLTHADSPPSLYEGVPGSSRGVPELGSGTAVALPTKSDTTPSPFVLGGERHGWAVAQLGVVLMERRLTVEFGPFPLEARGTTRLAELGHAPPQLGRDRGLL